MQELPVNSIAQWLFNYNGSHVAGKLQVNAMGNVEQIHVSHLNKSNHQYIYSWKNYL